MGAAARACELAFALREARLPYERGRQIVADVLDALWKKGVPGSITSGLRRQRIGLRPLGRPVGGADGQQRGRAERTRC